MKLCLISCNIRFDNPADGENAWPHRRNLLVQTLLAHNPTLIGTQEGRLLQLKELELNLSSFHLVDHHRTWINERMYPSIYTKKNLFDHISSGDIWLSETPHISGSSSFDSAFPRLATWSMIQLKKMSHPLTIVNTHLDHVKSHTRLHQAKVLCREVLKIWDPMSSLIIMGDFNDSPDSEVRKTIEENFPFLIDSWKKFNPVEESSHHAFKGEMQNGSRIDWILVDKKLAIQKCFMDKSSLKGFYPTDHYPVVCHLSL
jgi:endonuclease/exonuclease/phosphatase family metal-dependent hydrolase